MSSQAVARSRSPHRRGPIGTSREKHHRKWISTVTMHPHGPHTSTLFFLHGFMGDARSYAEAAEGVYWNGEGGLKVVLVNAPQRRVTCSDHVTNAWYDYLTDRAGEFCDVIDRTHFDDVVAAIHLLMQNEFDLVGPGNVSVGGYSQGGTIAVHAGLTWTGARLGGIYLISTTLLTTTPAVDPGCKIRVFHGLADEVFPWDKWAREGYARLLAIGADVEIHVQEGIYHVDDDWEAALIRKCFRSGFDSQAALKLQRVALNSAEIESANTLESVLRASRVVVQLMRRFVGFLVSVWYQKKDLRKSSCAELRDQMKAWQAGNWVQRSFCKRGGGEARFDLAICEVQSGHACACKPLPVIQEGVDVPSEGAVVLSAGVVRGGYLAYLTRTYFCHPSAQQRHVYRILCKLLDSIAYEVLRLGLPVSTLRKECAAKKEEYLKEANVKFRECNSKEMQRGTFEVYVHSAPKANESAIAGRLIDLDENGIVAAGAHVVTVGFALTGTPVRLTNKQSPLESIWLQDTAWVQGHPGGVTMILTQNASKEDASVMYVSQDEEDPMDKDWNIAMSALTEIQAELDAQKHESALKDQINKILKKPELQELLSREQDDDAGDDDEMEEHEEDKTAEKDNASCK